MLVRKHRRRQTRKRPTEKALLKSVRWMVIEEDADRPARCSRCSGVHDRNSREAAACSRQEDL